MTDAFSLPTLLNKDVKELYGYARELKIPNYSELSKKRISFSDYAYTRRETRLLPS